MACASSELISPRQKLSANGHHSNHIGQCITSAAGYRVGFDPSEFTSYLAVEHAQSSTKVPTLITLFMFCSMVVKISSAALKQSSGLHVGLTRQYVVRLRHTSQMWRRV